MRNIKTLSELRMEKRYCKQLIVQKEQILRDDTMKMMRSFKQQAMQTLIKEGTKLAVLRFFNKKRKKNKEQ